MTGKHSSLGGSGLGKPPINFGNGGGSALGKTGQ